REDLLEHRLRVPLLGDAQELHRTDVRALLDEDAGPDGVRGEVLRRLSALLLRAQHERVVHGLGYGLAPAGERLRAVSNVVLGEAADAHGEELHELAAVVLVRRAAGRCAEDRKSTRLNSSHVSISYAVFCLKKKNTPAIS